MANSMACTEWDTVLEDRFDSFDDTQLTLQPSLKITSITLAAQQAWNQQSKPCLAGCIAGGCGVGDRAQAFHAVVYGSYASREPYGVGSGG
jgi:hypothetical protein